MVGRAMEGIVTDRGTDAVVDRVLEEATAFAHENSGDAGRHVPVRQQHHASIVRSVRQTHLRAPTEWLLCLSAAMPYR